jgi:hypothetical protein
LARNHYGDPSSSAKKSPKPSWQETSRKPLRRPFKFNQ